MKKEKLFADLHFTKQETRQTKVKKLSNVDNNRNMNGKMMEKMKERWKMECQGSESLACLNDVL